MNIFRNRQKILLSPQLKSYPLALNKDNIQLKLDWLVQQHQKSNSLRFKKERTNNTKFTELHI
jgi:hypothetical protein